jgi:hypothetical protein
MRAANPYCLAYDTAVEYRYSLTNSYSWRTYCASAFGAARVIEVTPWRLLAPNKV